MSEQKRPLTKFESFFWIGQPVKHMEKNKILNYIFAFLEECIEEKNEVEEHFVSNKVPLYQPRIWIMDNEGRLSYLKKNDELVDWPEPEEK